MGSPTLVVMAAGIGSRCGGLKQVEAIGPAGERLVEYAVFDARRAGFERVVFVIRREIDTDFRRAIGARLGGRLPIEYAYQELDDPLPRGFTVPEGRTRPWGTVQTVLAVEQQVAGPFVILNA